MAQELKESYNLIKKLPLIERLSISHMQIRVKLAIAITLIILLTIIILSYIVLTRQKENLYQHTVKMGKTSLNYFVNNARHPLVRENILELNTLINEAASVEGILYALIVDRNGVIKAHTDIAMIGKPYRMTQQLWKDSIMQKSFGRYVSPEVVEPIAPRKLKGKSELIESFKVTGISGLPEKFQQQGRVM